MADAIWRVGRKLGRTLYLGDACVGMVDTPELAAEIVEAMNDVLRLREDLDRVTEERDEFERQIEDEKHNTGRFYRGSCDE